MPNNFVIALLDGIDSIDSELSDLPDNGYRVYKTSQPELPSVLEKILPDIEGDMEKAFIILLSKEGYSDEMSTKEISSLVIASKIRAETAFLVIAESFTDEEIGKIVQCNHLFCPMMITSSPH